jgi:hypothetical protein
MDWLIYHLTGDVLTHYWYVVQCKLYGFIPNKTAERVIASAILRSKDIPDHLVKLFPGGQDVAQVISVNHFPSIYMSAFCPPFLKRINKIAHNGF